jgi:GT2 family glycosyltransferase
MERRPPGSSVATEPPAPPAPAPPPPAGDAAAPAAASVVAVVVAQDPGQRFERTIRSLVAQRHPQLVVLVVDAGVEPVAGRVAAIDPAVFVRRTPAPCGWAEAANTVLGTVEGAGWYLFCHDDVDVAPDAVELLVGTAVQRAAVAATPKLLQWSDRERLLAVGMGVDRTARPVPTVDRVELDQSQHDGVREVAAGSSACLLVRADRFAALGGFDPLCTPRPASTRPDAEAEGASVDPLRAIAASLGAPELGEDVDLCWRLRASGGTIVVVTDARVAHAQEAHAPLDGSAMRVLARSAVARRNRLRTTLVVRSGPRRWFRALLVVLQGLVAARGVPRRTVARAVPDLRPAAIRERRRRVHDRAERTGGRRSAQRTFDRLHPPVLRRFRSALQTELAEDGARAWWLAQRTAGGLRRLPGRIALAIGSGLAVGFLIGSRWVLRDGASSVSTIAAFPGPRSILDVLVSGYRPVGAGMAGASPPGLVVVAAASWLTLGREGLAHTSLTVGLLAIGAVGMWRLARAIADVGLRSAGVVVDPGAEPTRASQEAPTRLRRAAEHDALVPGPEALERHDASLVCGAVAALAFAANPLATAAFARGRWETLVVVAAVPWILRAVLASAGLARASGGAAAGPLPGSGADIRPVPLLRSLLPIAVPVAVSAALAPSLVTVTVLAVLGIALSAPLWSTSRARGAVQLLVGALVVVAGAFILLLPWSVQALGRPQLLGDPRTAPAAALVDALRFHPWSGAGSWLVVGLPVAALIGLLVAEGARFDAVVGSWGMVLVSLAAAVGRSRLDSDLLPGVDTLLVPAAVGVAIAVGMTALALVTDLRHRTFGWRQFAAPLAMGLTLLAAAPQVARIRDGRWEAPARSHAEALGWMSERQRVDGSFRVLWLGDPAVVPGWTWRYGDLGVAITRDGAGDIRSAWAGTPGRAVDAVMAGVAAARARGTNRVGAVLAAAGIRYVAVAERPAPGAGPLRPVPDDLRQSLGVQLDLREIEVASDGLRVFENTDWVPIRALVGPGTGARPVPVLLGTGVTRAASDVDRPGLFRLTESFPERWRIRLDDRAIPSLEAAAIPSGPSAQLDIPQLGIATALPTPGRLSVRYLPSPAQRIGQIVSLAIWALVLLASLDRWRRRRRSLVEALQSVSRPLERRRPDAFADDPDLDVDPAGASYAAGAVTDLASRRRVPTHRGPT